MQRKVISLQRERQQAALAPYAVVVGLVKWSNQWNSANLIFAAIDSVQKSIESCFPAIWVVLINPGKTRKPDYCHPG